MPDIFLLIGQSNMAGRGVLTAENRITDGRVKTLVNGRFMPMWEPLSKDREFAGASLAPAFAVAYADYTGREVGLVPCADGGSGVAEWQPGEPLFENAVNDTLLAVRAGTLKAVLWHQGEHDVPAEHLAHYPERFMTMVNALHDRFGDPDLPFYVGALGDYLADNPHTEHYAHLADFNAMLQTVAKTQKHITFVSAAGLTDKGDKLHFDTPSLRAFGKRYFAAYLADHPDLETASGVTQIPETPTAEGLAAVKKAMEAGSVSREAYEDYLAAYVKTL